MNEMWAVREFEYNADTDGTLDAAEPFCSSHLTTGGFDQDALKLTKTI